MSLDLLSILAQAGVGSPPPQAVNTRGPATYWTDRPCQARGTRCNNRGMIIPVNGVDQLSAHCEFHACRKVERGMLCREAKLPKSAAYCNEHLRCIAMDAGGRCLYDVKNGNSGKYSYCDAFRGFPDLCKAKDCVRQRFQSTDGEDRDYCTDHGCGRDGCRRQRKDRGPFCSEHTCEADGCYNEAYLSSGSIGAKLCDRHRRCRAGHCSRVCDVWEDGHVAPHCAAHCCQMRGCENEKRSSARYCASHQCAKGDCNRSRGRGGTYCEEHKCARRTCQDRRRGSGRFCPAHTCVRSGCESEAGLDRFCSRHDPVDEYQRYRGAAQRVEWPSRYVGRLCPHRHPDLCHIPDCIEHSTRALRDYIHADRTSVDTSTFVECDYRHCDDLCRRGHRYCRRHKCELDSCLRLKSGLGVNDSRESAGVVSSRFCTQHECDVPRCTNQSAGNRTYCSDHTCRARDCERKARPGSSSGHCDFCERGSADASSRWDGGGVYDGTGYASSGWPVWPQFRRA